MDDQLKRFLEGHDERYWTETVRRLTYEAIRLLVRYGFGGANRSEKAAEYAVDAVSEAFDRAAKGSPSSFDLSKGDQTKAADERFWAYLVWNCLRPLITRDAEKWASRSRWPMVPLEEAKHQEIDAAAFSESDAQEVVDRLIEASEGPLRDLLMAARAQFDEDPDRTTVNWKAVQNTLGISRYACDALRRDLNDLCLRLENAKATASRDF